MLVACDLTQDGSKFQTLNGITFVLGIFGKLYSGIAVIIYIGSWGDPLTQKNIKKIKYQGKQVYSMVFIQRKHPFVMNLKIKTKKT